MFLSMIRLFLRAKFRAVTFLVFRHIHPAMTWYSRRRIGPALPQIHPPLSLFGLPPELQVMVYNDAVRGAEAPSELKGLGTCRTLYYGMNAALSRLRSSVVYSVDDQYWGSPISPTRDQKMYQALTAADRRAIDIVKFTGNDGKLDSWAPHMALLTLATHQIRPRTIILFDAFSRHPATHDIDALADATNRLLILATAQQLPISTIKICKVPQDLVFFLGCRLLNLGFVPNMDIQQMTDELWASFEVSGDVCIEIEVPVLRLSGATIAMITVHITKLNV